MDYTVYGILQARIQEWVAFLFSQGSSQPRDWTQVSCITGGFFISWATREAQELCLKGQSVPKVFEDGAGHSPVIWSVTECDLEKNSWKG